MAQKLSFAENFALSGCAAVISKTAAAPIERIKLLIQNQDEMIKQVRLLIFMTHLSAKLYDLKFMTPLFAKRSETDLKPTETSRWYNSEGLPHKMISSRSPPD